RGRLDARETGRDAIELARLDRELARIHLDAIGPGERDRSEHAVDDGELVLEARLGRELRRAALLHGRHQRDDFASAPFVDALVVVVVGLVADLEVRGLARAETEPARVEAGTARLPCSDLAARAAQRAIERLPAAVDALAQLVSVAARVRVR